MRITPKMKEALLWSAEQDWFDENYMQLNARTHLSTIKALERAGLVGRKWGSPLTEEGRRLARQLYSEERKE